MSQSQTGKELHLNIRRDWTEMIRVNELAYDFLESMEIPAPAVDTFTMVICELVENGIKYSYERGKSSDTVELLVTIDKDIITVHVMNSTGRGNLHHLRKLDRTLQWIRGFQDPFQAYIERVREISRELTNQKISGLGIVRIAYEARAAIDFVVGEDGSLSVSAVAKIR